MIIRFFLLNTLIVSSLLANKSFKWKLNNNSTVTFLEIPKDVNSLLEMLTKGKFYGRLQLNNFLFDWDEEVVGDKETVAKDGTKKLNPSYTDVRFELNYLF